MNEIIEQNRVQQLLPFVEYTGKRKDGSYFPVRLYHTLMPLGQHTQTVIILLDITQSRVDEQWLRMAKDEAEKANRAKSEFLANMSHELRIPMHGILSFSNMAINNTEKLDRNKLLEYFGHIRTSGDRLLSRLNDLLDLAKLESGKMDMNFSTGSLESVARGCIAEQQGFIYSRAYALISRCMI